MTTPSYPEGILDVAFGFMKSKTLLSAVELGLFTTLAGQSLTLEELRERLGLHPRAARDFLDALVSLGLLTRAEGRYANTPETDYYLDRNKPTYTGGILEMMNARLYSFWGQLSEGLKTGAPQNEARTEETDLFAAIYADPARLEGFLRAMSGASLAAARQIAKKFPWRNYTSFADIGCAQGAVPATLALAYPHLTGIGFDLPQVQPVFERYIAEHGLAERVHFAAGDFFNDALPEADVLIMGHILHDWDLQTKRMLLDKAYAALPPGGALIVYEMMIDDRRCENTLGLMMSLNMLIETQGGFDYTGADAMQWMRDAGFADTEVVPLGGPDSMAIGRKT